MQLRSYCQQILRSKWTIGIVYKLSELDHNLLITRLSYIYTTKL